MTPTEDDLIEEPMDYTPIRPDDVIANGHRWQRERDRLQRLFYRLEAAISHHRAACEANDLPDTHDEALWAARDRVLKDATEGNG